MSLQGFQLGRLNHMHMTKHTLVIVKWKRARSENMAARLQRFTVSGRLIAVLQKQRAGI